MQHTPSWRLGPKESSVNILGLATLLGNPLAEALIAAAGEALYGTGKGMVEAPKTTTAAWVGGNYGYGAIGGAGYDSKSFYGVQAQDAADRAMRRSPQEIIAAGLRDLARQRKVTPGEAFDRQLAGRVGTTVHANGTRVIFRFPPHRYCRLPQRS